MLAKASLDLNVVLCQHSRPMTSCNWFQYFLFYGCFTVLRPIFLTGGKHFVFVVGLCCLPLFKYWDFILWLLRPSLEMGIRSGLSGSEWVCSSFTRLPAIGLRILNEFTFSGPWPEKPWLNLHTYIPLPWTATNVNNTFNRFDLTCVLSFENNSKKVVSDLKQAVNWSGHFPSTWDLWFECYIPPLSPLPTPSHLPHSLLTGKTLTTPCSYRGVSGCSGPGKTQRSASS